MGRASNTKAFRKAYRVAMAEAGQPVIKHEDYRRQFDGKLTGFADKTEQSFYQRMLRAYLKGKEFFAFGTERNEFGMLIPEHFRVAQSFK